MNKLAYIFSLSIFLSFRVVAQDTTLHSQSRLQLQGQLSGFAHFNGKNDLPLCLGGRYIPQLNYLFELSKNRFIDFEYSANIFGNAALDPFNDSDFSGRLKNYRAWTRFSTPQFELRAGLQKINFGSASILRPLMWFDQIDPRDPLRLTDGVWGILARYYFLNNANIWIWGLCGNKAPRGWELAKTSFHTPEFGGRLQLPLSKGEAAFSFHHRNANTEGINVHIPEFASAPENRFGVDAKFDMIVGGWVEASWVTNSADLGMFTNQETVNIGMDYTLGIGSGLYLIYEQLLTAYDQRAFAFSNTTTFSLLNLSYPVGIFDNLSAIIYYDWTNNKSYNFINWQKQFDKISLYLIAYWNPEIFQVPTQSSKQNLFGGKGIQFMFVFNH